MIATSLGRTTRAGWVRGWRARHAALPLWLAQASLAGCVTIPVWRRWSEVLDASPEADRLLQGFSLDLLAETTRAAAGWPQQLFAALGVAVVAAWLLNALLAGGVLGALRRAAGAAWWPAFAHSAACHAKRFLGLGLWAAATLCVACGLVLGATRALARPAIDSNWEPGRYLVLGGGLALAALVALLLLLALDIARIMTSDLPELRVRRAWILGLRIVARRPFTALACWAGPTLAFGLVMALYLLLRQFLHGSSWAGIASLLLVQQAVMVIRAQLRVTLWATLLAWLEPAP